MTIGTQIGYRTAAAKRILPILSKGLTSERDKADEEEEREVIVFLWFVHDIKSLCWEVSGVEPFEQSEIWKELLAHESEICRLKRSERVLYTILGAIAGAERGGKTP